MNFPGKSTIRVYRESKVVLMVLAVGAAVACGNVAATGVVAEATDDSTVVFDRRAEPRENAFDLLVPKGWLIDGGVMRVDPTAQGGAAQSIEAKLDFSVKSDGGGRVLLRWLPDTWFIDASMTPAGQMGLFPPGSNYNGMTVMPALSARDFLQQVAFPFAHPTAEQVEIVDGKALPKLAQDMTNALNAMVPMLAGQVRYDAGMIRVRYSESGRRYEEVMVTAIENMGQIAAGMWRNRQTEIARAPIGELPTWEPVMAVVRSSVRLNPQWVAGELRGQAIRSNTLNRTMQEINRIGEEIAQNRERTNWEIQNDMFLTLMEQEEYVNPYTNEVEVGSDQWKHRWVNESGDIIYTDREGYDPNTDIHVNRSDFKRTPVRQRSLQ